MSLLIGDIGGTHTRLRLVEPQGNHFETLRESRYESGGYERFDGLLADFLNHCGERPTAACLGVAGPVRDEDGRQRVQTTNLPWRLDSEALARETGVRPFALINDFEAVGHALDGLSGDQLACLQAGEPRPGGLRALIGAGTGLGQALLCPLDGDYRVLPTEGGHMDFAPQTPLQWQLAEALRARHGHVSVERLASGPGLAFIYEFLNDRETEGGERPDPAWISRQALEQGDAVALAALDEFTAIYGAQAGNLALACLPFGGLYVAGGIAPRLHGERFDRGFMAAFLAKGRMEPLLRRIPVHIVMHPEPGLLGAARLAARLGGAR